MAKKDRPFNNPFAKAEEALRKKVETAPAPKKKEPVKPPPPPESEEASFADMMAGIDRLNEDSRHRVPPPIPAGTSRSTAIHDEDAEAFAELASLVDGTGRFDIEDTDEFIEGCAEGLDRRILRRLRRGDFSIAAHIDLHGLTRIPARAAVEDFLNHSRTNGHRCVLIVHGRGLNSKDNLPVLKLSLKSWLERGRIARNILAFCTARPHDGGAGAVYVLLRK